jgi:metal-dependent hydrolase (beta-lactamase superfamily II)
MGTTTFDEVIKYITNQENVLEELVGKEIFSYREKPLDTTFIVARQWNSWYPSYFNVVGGGSYLIQTAKAYSEDKSKLPSMPPKKPSIILIDPGFGFLRIVRTLGIDVEDIDTVIITHFHPDHMNGIFEYINLRLNVDRATTIFMNPTTFNALGRAGKKDVGNVDIYELTPSSAVTLAEYQRYDKKYERIIVRAVPTYHTEVTNTSHTIGLIFEIKQSKSKFFKDNERIKQKTIGILGDTDAYTEHLKEYANEFYKCDVLVLHVGTFANKAVGKPGKHLYREGTQSLLEKLKEKDTMTKKKKLILLSEFGLENASLDQLYKAIIDTLDVNPWQAIFGYYIERRESNKNKKDNKTSLAGVAYAFWFYNGLVNPSVYEDSILVALGLGCMLWNIKECEQILAVEINKDKDIDTNDRDLLVALIINEIRQNFAKDKGNLKKLEYLVTMLLTDAILARFIFYGEVKLEKMFIIEQLKNLESALKKIEDNAKKKLTNLGWLVSTYPLYDEFKVFKERLQKMGIRYQNIVLDELQEYETQSFLRVLLCTIVGINCLRTFIDEDKIWQNIQDTASSIYQEQPPLKRIEEKLREENDWCILFIADVGCEVVLGNNIKMKTRYGEELDPKEIESRYEGGRLKRLIYEKKK